MKVILFLMSFFFFLVVGGSFTYLLILWKQYWIRVNEIIKDSQKPVYPSNMARLEYDEVTSKFMIHRLPAKTTTTTPAPRLNESQIWKEQVYKHETDIRGQLRRALVDTSKRVDSDKVINLYRVNFTGTKSMFMSPKMTPHELVCDAMNEIKLETFVEGDAFFKSQEMDQYLLKRPILDGKVFQTCAVVPSSGSLLNSNLGPLIDKNEFVIRFNHAPTKGYVKDVGEKTSLRIVNSQVVGKPEYHFLDSKLYSQTPVLVWDPSRYSDTLDEWFSHPDYPFFETFFSKRLMSPTETLHLMKPSSLWSIWDWMQTNSKHSILPNPPSSGFLGILLALKHCHQVSVFEFVPSIRMTKRCHYYDSEENFGCTMGDWHPLSAEKLLALAFNVASREDVFGHGYLVMDGSPKLNCKS